MRSVLCCGNITLDMPVWPVESEFRWNTTTWVETITESIGGNGANTSYTLGMLGVPVRLISSVGQDARGDRAVEILRSAGVDVSHVARSPEKPTPATVVLVRPGGDRMFLHRPGASRELAIDSVTLDHGQEFTYFHFANPFALPNLRRQTADVMRMAKEAGLTTSIDTGWDSQNRWLEDLGPALPFTDMLFVNDSEARMLGSVEDLDTCANNLQALGVKDIVIKTGPGGCILYTRELRTEVPGFEAQAIDTTGAGDCFAGGFLAGMHRGWTYADSARLANAVGAMNVESLGAATGIRSFEETCAWIEARANLIG